MEICYTKISTTPFVNKLWTQDTYMHRNSNGLRSLNGDRLRSQAAADCNPHKAFQTAGMELT